MSLKWQHLVDRLAVVSWGAEALQAQSSMREKAEALVDRDWLVFRRSCRGADGLSVASPPESAVVVCGVIRQRIKQ